MSDDLLAACLITYLFCMVVTLLSQGDAKHLERRMFLWPLYWLYLVASFTRELFRARS